MLRSSLFAIALTAGLLGACSLDVEGADYSPGSGGSTGAGGMSMTNGASSGAAGGGQSSSTGANTGSEDCSNGKDDNGDGAVDCADSKCSFAAACEAIPPGWTLVTAEFLAPNAQPGQCADGTTGALYFTNPAGAPTCVTCTCGTPTQVTCSAPEISCWYTNGCNNMPDFTIKDDSNQCDDLTNGKHPGITIPSDMHNPGGCKLTAKGTVLAGTCVPTGGDLMPSPMWGGALHVCGMKAVAGGCDKEGDVCIPKPSTAPICIMREGENACPSGWSSGTLAFASGQDNRKCSPCGCELGCMGGQYVIYDNKDCKTMGPPPVTIDTTNCKDVHGIFDFSDTSLSPTPATAVIEACVGGQAQGQVDPSGPQQICCKQ